MHGGSLALSSSSKANVLFHGPELNLQLKSLSLRSGLLLSQLNLATKFNRADKQKDKEN